MTKVLLALGLAASLATPCLAAAPATGKLMHASGVVKLNGKSAHPGAVLKVGDRLETGPHAEADVALADGSAIRLYDATTLTLTSLGKHVRLTLARGRALNVVHHGSDYQMGSPGAIAAVRGTVFYLQNNGPKQPGYVCICHGKIETTNPHTQHSELHQATHHAGFTLVGDHDATASMMGHTDADIAELQKLAH